MAAVFERMAIRTGIDTLKIIDAAEDAVRPIMDQEPVIDRLALIMGYAGVYSSFLKHAYRAADRYGVSGAEILFECGRQGLVGGQEDQIIQIADEIGEQRAPQTRNHFVLDESLTRPSGEEPGKQAKMRFGIALDLGAGSSSLETRLAESRTLVSLAETLGFRSVWAGEHYASDPDSFHLPASLLALANLSSATTTMVLGTGVTPLYKKVLSCLLGSSRYL